VLDEETDGLPAASSSPASRYAAKGKWAVRTGVSHIVRNRRQFIRKSAVRDRDLLNLGCGHSAHPDFINLDWAWKRQIDICWDLAKELPLEDASLSGIYSEHCLEHLPLPVIDRVLADCYRILKPGGVLRIVVPDGEMYLTGYSARHNGDSAATLPFADGENYRGFYTPMLSVNRIFEDFGHKFIFDLETMRSLLELNGFADITRTDYMHGRDERLLIDRKCHIPESLYVEAIKPA
jgi:predicted SAM-dependent methyltransferase